MARTYTIKTSWNGRLHVVNFCTTGNAPYRPGHVASYDEYHAELSEFAGVTDFQLLYVDAIAGPKFITSYPELCEAMISLPKGGVLNVSMVSVGVQQDPEDFDPTIDGPTIRPQENAKEAKLAVVIQRFFPYQCYDCKATGFDGKRWAYTPVGNSRSSGNFFVCGKCHSKMSKNRRKNWVLVGTPWDCDVPAPPLSRRQDHRVEHGVIHLQYLLTRFGFLSLSATSSQIGSYQTATENAVREFRNNHNIPGENLVVYDKKCAVKLYSLVRKARENGYTHL